MADSDLCIAGGTAAAMMAGLLMCSSKVSIDQYSDGILLISTDHNQDVSV